MLKGNGNSGVERLENQGRTGNAPCPEEKTPGVAGTLVTWRPQMNLKPQTQHDYPWRQDHWWRHYSKNKVLGAGGCRSDGRDTRSVPAQSKGHKTAQGEATRLQLKNEKALWLSPVYTSRHVREQSSSRARVARMRSRYSVLGSGKECWRQSRRRRAVLPAGGGGAPVGVRGPTLPQQGHHHQKGKGWEWRSNTNQQHG